MTVEELRQAIERSQPIVINPDGTPSTSAPTGQDEDSTGTLVKPQVWAVCA
jgi:hypothetical protein